MLLTYLLSTLNILLRFKTYNICRNKNNFVSEFLHNLFSNCQTILFSRKACERPHFYSILASNRFEHQKLFNIPSCTVLNFLLVFVACETLEACLLACLPSCLPACLPAVRLLCSVLHLSAHLLLLPLDITAGLQPRPEKQKDVWIY